MGTVEATCRLILYALIAGTISSAFLCIVDLVQWVRKYWRTRSWRRTS